MFAPAHPSSHLLGSSTHLHHTAVRASQTDSLDLVRQQLVAICAMCNLQCVMCDVHCARQMASGSLGRRITAPMLQAKSCSSLADVFLRSASAARYVTQLYVLVLMQEGNRRVCETCVIEEPRCFLPLQGKEDFSSKKSSLQSPASLMTGKVHLE